MYPFNIEKTKEMHLTPMSGCMVSKIEPWLKRNGVRYEVLAADDERIRPDIPRVYTYRGRTMTDFIVFLYANLFPWDLRDVCEDMFFLTHDEV